jgi:hypothetical protein
MLDFLERGSRLAQPKGCPDQYFALMKACWGREPEQRPTFTRLRASLSQLLDSKTSDEYNYVDLQAGQSSYFDVAEMERPEEATIEAPAEV